MTIDLTVEENDINMEEERRDMLNMETEEVERRSMEEEHEEVRKNMEEEQEEVRRNMLSNSIMAAVMNSHTNRNLQVGFFIHC